MADRHWLYRLTCCDDGSRGLSAQYTARPYHVHHGGEYWTVATNAQGMLFVAGLVRAEGIGPPENGAVGEKLASFFEPKGDSILALPDLAGLKAWLGSPQWQGVCPDCQGRGKTLEESQDPDEDWCGECEGYPVGPDSRPGLLADVPIDRNLLARYLDHQEGKALLYSSGRGGTPLWLVGDGWRVVFMPLDPKRLHDRPAWPDAWKTAPAFPVDDFGPRLAAVPFDTQLRMVYADWLEDRGEALLSAHYHRQAERLTVPPAQGRKRKGVGA